MNFWFCLFFSPSICLGQAVEEIEKVSLSPIHDLQRADLYVLKLTEQPVGVLVLSPGCNGNGKDLVQNPVWQQFARDHKLDLVGVSFASDVSLLTSGRGYYYPRQGSGQILLEGLRHIFHQDLPLVMYGFSGGAHFTSGFVEWKPERVLAWCAYSAGWWDKPSSNDVSPPGLVVCGEDDERYGASLMYFKQGRALGKPWLWISVPENGHSISAPVEDFLRNYFAALLRTNGQTTSGQWVDIDCKTNAEQGTIRNQPSETGWLPDAKLLPEWQTIHQP